LTEKIKFSEIAGKAIEYVGEEGSMHDVILMLRLGFSPPSWKIWKSKLAEMFSIKTFSKLGDDSGTVRIKMEYNKKEKLWSVIEVE